MKVIADTVTLEQLYEIFGGLRLSDVRPEDFPIVFSWAGQTVEVSFERFFAVLQKETHAHRSWCSSNLN